MDKPKPTYIVTGTTRGIGRALADGITRRGFALFSLNRRPDSQHGLQRNFFCDLSDPAGVRQAMTRLIQAIDPAARGDIVLINNAGVLVPILSLEKINDQQLGANLHTNLAAPIQLMSQFIDLAPVSFASRRIINVTSGAAGQAYAGWSLYCAAKAALNMITACLALEQEQRPSPVGVCAVAPGVVDTDMQRQIMDARPENFPMQERFRQFRSSGQLSAPQTVADLILDLDLSGQLVSGGIYDLRDVRWENGRSLIAPRRSAYDAKR